MPIYTVASLKEKFPTLQAAKTAHNIKARSWAALAEKLNMPSYDDLKAQLVAVTAIKDFLEAECARLKMTFSAGNDFDSFGFWLFDNNFDRSRFSDFQVPPDATRRESAARSFYKQHAQTYHPDKGGTEEQMRNLKTLLDQLLTLVELNEGLGK